MKLLRRYQLDIVFFFFAMTVIIGLAFYGLKKLGMDPHDFEWYVAGPLIVLFLVHLLHIRQSIDIHERRALTNKSLVYWLALGITLFASYRAPIAANDYWSINVLFLIFTILLADSYWDFKEISLKKIFKRTD